MNANSADGPAISKDDCGDKTGARLALPGIFLISLSVLAFEVALTRVFSVMLSYHFVFAIVSAAMLGLGVGGLLFKRFAGTLPQRAIWVGAVAYSLSIVASLILILTLPIATSQGLAGARFWIYLALAVVPFGAAGFTTAGLFQRFPERGSLLYGADLLGAAAGALLIVPAMDRVGAVNVVFFLAAVAAAGALLLGLPQLKRALPALGILIVLASLFTGLVVTRADLTVPIANDINKDMFTWLSDPQYQAQTIESRWSSFGRTDLVRSDLLPGEMTLFVDGAAGAPMYDLNAILTDRQARRHFTAHAEEYFPFIFLPRQDKRSALVIGPGGGRDVVVALLGGVKDVTAVEVNPDVVRIVKDYSDFNGGIYSGRPGVTAVVSEGRSYVRTTRKNFDLIMLSIPITKSSRSVDGYALTENYLYTTEAFQDYFRRLTDNGRIVIVAHNDAEIVKLVATALGAFARQGVSQSEAMKHIYTVGSDMMPALVIQRQPLTVAEANRIHAKLHELRFDKSAFYVPFVKQEMASTGAPMFDPFLFDVADGRVTIGALAGATNLDLRPATDDRPFFFEFTRGLPSPFGAFGVLMGFSVVALVVLLCLPRKSKPDPLTFLGALRDSLTLKAYVVLFFALGIGYMLIEIAFFQKLTLYVQPQMALTVLLFSLLLGGGMGSLLTSLVARTRLRAGTAAALGIALGVVVLGLVFARVFATGLDPRLAAMVIIFPLGVLMGCPFPLAVKSLSRHGLARHVAVMWGVNGVASVFGSAVAMIMGISWGFWSALMGSAGIYIVIAALFAILAKMGPAAVADGRGEQRRSRRARRRSAAVTT